MKKLAFALAALSLSAAALADDGLRLGTGFDYSTGKYGNAESTDILYVPLIGKYDLDKASFKLVVPYISVDGPGGVVRGIGRLGPRSTRNGRSSNSGLGDIVGTAGYEVWSNGSFVVDVVGNVKLGTADAGKGLGTGKNDYSAQVDGYYRIGPTTLFGTVGYMDYGSPAGVDLRSIPYFTLGVSRKIDEEDSVGVMLDVASSPASGGADRREATFFAARKLSRGITLQGSVLTGFANGSPDLGVGLTIIGRI